jgi:hypothetical protein
MKRNISEDLPARKFAPAASTGGKSAVDSGGGDMEKKARQLVYDSKYQVKKEMGPDTKMDPAAVVKAVLGRIDKSEYSQPIKARARKIVMGDNQVKEMKEFASHNVARALYSVFVEQPSKIIDEEYIEKLKRELSEADQSPEERKYKVRVTDKETGNSYIRMANRSKINELRANPNIVSVEMLDLYGSPEPSESERTKGSQTASVTAGRGLKNNDGNLANNYPPYNKVTRGDVIAGATGKDQMGGKRKVKEEFIGEKDNGDENQPLEPMKKGKKNKCKVYGPSTKDDLMMHQELEGGVIAETGYSKFLKKVRSLQEMAVSQNQQQLAGMALEYLDGNMPDASDAVKQMAKMEREELKKFARTSHEGLPEKVKEEMDYDDKKKKSEEETCEDDPRSMRTKINLVKNKMRAMGLKMSYEPEGKMVDEALRSREERMSRMMTSAQRKKQEQNRKREEELSHRANLELAGMKKTAKPGAVTKTETKPSAPESNRKIKTGKKVDTLAVKANKIISSSYEPEGEMIDELTKYAEKTGKKFTTGRKSVKGGNPEIKARVKNEPWLKYGGSRQERKDRTGEVVPVAAGEPGSGRQSPEHMLKSRRAKEQRAREQRPGSRYD